jgi:Caspase domain
MLARAVGFRFGLMLVASCVPLLAQARFTTPLNPDLWQGSKVYALVVGVATYSESTRNLRYCDDDAHRINAFLRSPEGGAVPEASITLLINEDATNSGIAAALTTITQRADSNDVVIFFFSGHGSSRGILPYDYSASRNNVVAYATINNQLTRAKSKTKLVLLDACNSGGIFSLPSAPKPVLARHLQGLDVMTGRRAGQPTTDNEFTSRIDAATGKPREFSSMRQAPAAKVPSRVLSASTVQQASNTPSTQRPSTVQPQDEHSALFVLPNNTAYLVSSSSLQTSREFLEGRQGYFTFYLLEGLRGKADGGQRDGTITLGELSDYLHREVSSATESRQVPESHSSLNPNLAIGVVRR